MPEILNFNFSLLLGRAFPLFQVYPGKADVIIVPCDGEGFEAHGCRVRTSSWCSFHKVLSVEVEEDVFRSDTSRGINLSINYSQNISSHANMVESSPIIGLSRDLLIDWHDLQAWVSWVSFPSLVAFLAELIFGQRSLSYFILSTHVDNVPGKINSNINHYGRLWTKSVSITKDSCFQQPLCSACSSNN